MPNEPHVDGIFTVFSNSKTAKLNLLLKMVLYERHMGYINVIDLNANAYDKIQWATTGGDRKRSFEYSYK